MSLFYRLCGLALATAAIAPQLFAQSTPPKRSLTPKDWDHWRSISGATLSRDGKWAAYTVLPQVGDAELVVRSTQGTTEYRVPRGYLGRPNNIPGGLRAPAAGSGEGEPTGPAASPAQFTSDGRFVIVSTQETQAEVERAFAASRSVRGGRAPTAANRVSLAIVSVADGRVTTIAGVRSFRLPRENGNWLAYMPADSAADSTGGTAGPRGQPAGARDRRTYGAMLVLRNLDSGAEERLAEVTSYAFDDRATLLGYTIVSRDSTRDGAYLRSLSAGSTAVLASGRGNYKALVFDSAARQVAFLSDREEFGKEKARFTLFYGTVKGGMSQPVVRPNALAADLRIADNAILRFTPLGNAILFGVAPPVLDSVPSDSLTGKAVFDLWHYRDPTLQPSQKLSATRDRNRSFQAIYFPTTKKLTQLANDSIPSVDVSDDGRMALASSSVRYRIESMWGNGGNDIYLVDPTTGAARMIRERISGQAQLSPDARYVILFDLGRWYSHQTSTGKTVDLTGALGGVSFAQETWDTPSIPGAWGVAGWTKGDKSVLLYDRWDIWEFDPTGAKPAVMVTDSVGRKQHLVLRVVPIRRRTGAATVGAAAGFGGIAGGGGDPLDPAEALLLRAIDDETKASGFYRDRLDAAQAPERLVMAEAGFGIPQKADSADVWMVTRSTFVEFPNLWTGPSLAQLDRISDVNPQQKDSNWGTVELVRWVSTDGIPLKGLLYKPENFDPSKQYPMIAYFYESLSQNLHSYIPPNGRNVINPTHYVSNGYLIFEPDISYEAGYPGPSAMKSIIPGVQMLLARGYVDPKALGLQGQSWGGYQIAYMITQTRMFSAAMAGAPVANMTSAYGGIRWGSGLARAFQYEVGQSRIGGSIWESPMRFIENSPLFWLDKVTTPLFIMSNDMDDAVPWYQGIELFVGMRRLGKEIYMINYNNDVHNPAGRANQKDIAMRMQQFFDTKLKGVTAPEWMVKGIPYLAKGRDQLSGSAATSAGGTSPQP